MGNFILWPKYSNWSPYLLESMNIFHSINSFGGSWISSLIFQQTIKRTKWIKSFGNYDVNVFFCYILFYKIVQIKKRRLKFTREAKQVQMREIQRLHIKIALELWINLYPLRVHQVNKKKLNWAYVRHCVVLLDPLCTKNLVHWT